MRRLLILSACVGLMACTPAPNQTAEEPPAAAAPAPASDAAPDRKWIAADGLGATGLAYQENGATLLTLTCLEMDKSLVASGPLPVAAAPAPGAPASVVFSGAAFTGKTELSEVTGHTVAMTVPITADLLSAMSTATSARLAFGAASVETNPLDDGANLKRFAASCGRLTGLSRTP